jgi:hypothetical protein
MREISRPADLDPDIPALPMVSSVEVRGRRGAIHDVSVFDARAWREPSAYVEPDPPPHAPILTDLETRAEPYAYGPYTVTARLDCGDRAEQWEFTEEFTMLARQQIHSADAARHSFEVMAGLVLTITQRLRAEMSSALEKFAAQAVEASRVMTALRRPDAPFGRGARVQMPRVEDLRLPQITIEGGTLRSAAQYAAFVEMGRRQPGQPHVGIPRAQHDDPTDALNYAARPAIDRHDLRTRGGFTHRMNPETERHLHALVGMDFGREKTSAITPAMEERADALLRSLLTEEQRESLDRHGHFTITGQSGYRYQLSARARSYNVTMMGKGLKRPVRLCALPPNAYALPMADQLIAQMLMLKSDEQLFLSTANWD